MSEKYIKAADCEKYFYEHLDDVHIAAAMNAIDEMPTADVVPVVRCKDCKYAKYWYGNDKLDNETFLCYFLAKEGVKMFADNFCSYGERREFYNRKIRAIDPKIVVSGSADKPYYSIEYYNISDKRWHIGYGSYNLKFVKEWLTDDFETVEADIVPVCHGHWVKEKRDVLIHWHCSACKECFYLDKPNAEYCPHCGAKMDGGEEE